MNPKEELEKGIELLKPIMKASGFHFVLESEGNSSGGNYAQGAFISGIKRLSLSVRHTLGYVEYQIKDSVILHAQYMEALEKKDVAKYPGFSNHPVKAFKHLASGLSLYGELFLRGK